MAFFYVDKQGTVRLGRIVGPKELKLTDGTILPDPPPNGRLFAVEESAQKYAEFIKACYGNLRKADEMHRAWWEATLDERMEQP